MSLLRPLAAAGTTALGLVLAAATLSPVPAAAAAPRTVHVVASELPTGDAPRRDTLVDGRIVRPGKRSIRLPGRLAPSSVLRAHGGYLVVSSVINDRGRYRGDRIVSVRDDRRRRVLLRLTRQRIWTVASDGRSFVTSQADRRGRGGRLRVLGVRDGRPVGRPLRTRGSVRVLAASASRVLVRTQSGGPRTARLRWWTPRTGRVVTVPSDRPRGRPLGHAKPRVETASALRHVITLPTGQVIDDRRPGRRLWTLGKNESGLLFSPDARRLLTVSRGESTSQDIDFTHVRTVTVRDARSGRRAVSFTGVFAFDVTQPSGAVAWEDDDAFLIVAGDEVLRDEEGEQYVTNQRLVRCTVSSRSCETAGRDTDPWRIRLVVPRSR